MPSKSYRILLVHKRTRWDFLIRSLEDSSDEDAIARLSRRFPSVHQAHDHHVWAVSEIVRHLRRQFPAAEIVLSKSGEPQQGPASAFDVIFSAGGDGTFLEAASRIQTGAANSVKLYGINTDPARSEGRLLVRGATEQARGNWPWPWMREDGTWTVYEMNEEQRRKESIRDEHCDSVLKSYDKNEQIFSLWTDPVDHDSDDDGAPTLSPSEIPPSGPFHASPATPSEIPPSGPFHASPATPSASPRLVPRRIPWSDWATRVLDRIFGGETLPMRRQRVRVSVYSGDRADSDVSSLQSPSECPSLDGESLLESRHVALNDAVLLPEEPHHVLHVLASLEGGKAFPAKNSGILACTGTGSTAWAYNMTRISAEEVRSVLELAAGREDEAPGSVPAHEWCVPAHRPALEEDGL